MTEPTLPGEKGTDLLVLLWEAERCVFRPVAGLVRAAGGGAPQARAGIGLSGHGIVRDRATMRLFERLTRDAVVRRWRVRDPEGEQVEGRYRVAAFSAEAKGDYEIPCTMTLAPEPARARHGGIVAVRDEVFC